MTGAAAGPLSGVGVLVTRPAHQADGLCRLIERQGGHVIRFPVLEIRDPLDPTPLRAVCERLDDYDWAVFISANAVDRALGTILTVRRWPAGTRIAVIGRRSAEALAPHGLTADLFPTDKYDSEALLALPEMHGVAGQRFVIFRGDGGREHLAQTLRARGAEVDYVEAYRRVRPQTDAAPLLVQWRAGAVNVVVVNSAESLANLAELLGEPGMALARETALVVPSPRLVAHAAGFGFRQPPVVAANATDQAVVDALLVWRAQNTKIG